MSTTPTQDDVDRTPAVAEGDEGAEDTTVAGNDTVGSEKEVSSTDDADDDASAPVCDEEDGADTAVDTTASSSAIIGRAEANRAEALKRLQERKDLAKRQSSQDVSDALPPVSVGQQLDDTADVGKPVKGFSIPPPTTTDSSSLDASQSEKAVDDGGPQTPSAGKLSYAGGFMKWLGKGQSMSDGDKQQQMQLQREANARRSQLQRDAILSGHATERRNLLNMMKIATKTLIEGAVGLAESLTDSNHQLKQLLLLVEKILSHGIKTRKKSLWNVIDGLETRVPLLAELVAEAKAGSFKTVTGKARFCVRSMMNQQTLPVFLRIFTEEDSTLSEFYEPWAFLAEDGAAVLAGLVMGLCVIDINLALDPELLDTESGILDMSFYLKEGNYLRKAVPEDENAPDKRFSEKNFNALTDQNATLKELNKSLDESVKDKEATIEALKAEMDALREDVTKLENAKFETEEKNEQLGKELAALKENYEKKIDATAADIEVERTTYNQSRMSLNEMLDAMQKQLDTECALREEVEKDREYSKRQQLEAEANLEKVKKSMEAQEELISTLRKQLKEVKSLNLTMLSNMQELQGQIKEKSSNIHELQQEKDKLKGDIHDAQQKMREAHNRRERLQAALTEVSNRLKLADGKRVEAETQLTVEKNWREGLQEDLKKAEEKLEEMSLAKSQLGDSQRELQALQSKYAMLQKSFKEQEHTLMELGEQLSEKALQVDTFENMRKKERQKQWEDDSEVKECKQCDRSFSVKRRKHHCRKCGGIFCAECSDNKMQLPSYAKPVRVCDTCQRDLLANHH